MNEVLAVILGGGAGTRLFPLTYLRSKPAVPLAGKYRLIDVPISNCINSGMDRIFVLTQFNSASLNRHIAQAYRFDRFRQGFVSILAAEQTPGSNEWFQGTADAVRQSLKHLGNTTYKDILILSGDQLYSMDYRLMHWHHVEHDADITIASIPVVAHDAPGFGILKTGENEVITEFYEKPPIDELEGKESHVSEEMESQGRVYLASMGIYVFRSHTLLELLRENPGAHDFGKQIIPLAIKSKRVVNYPFTGYWSDIGTIRSFYEANLMLAREKPEFNMYDPDFPLYTNARMLPPAKIQNSHITNSIVAEASVVVDSTISNSVVGIRSFISSGTEIRNTVIMGANYFPWQSPRHVSSENGPANPGIGEGTVIENAIVDRNASVGRNCVLKNSEGLSEANGDGYYIRDGLIVVPKNGAIPDGTVI
ncbi:MAG: glucose-1-phosphate adenylyltransferase [Bacteroidetes bacterium]|nr:glucose-1-phosphate adenylyltransferase [Bacteroidota bacterium]